MHLTDEAQPRHKAILVQEAFRRLGKKEIPLPEVVTGPAWGYRSRLQLHKDRAGSPAGFRARASDKTVAVRECPVAVSAFGPLLASGGAELPVGRINAFAVGTTAYFDGKYRRVTLEVAGKRLASSLDGFFQSNLELCEE